MRLGARRLVACSGGLTRKADCFPGEIGYERGSHDVSESHCDLALHCRCGNGERHRPGQVAESATGRSRKPSAGGADWLGDDRSDRVAVSPVDRTFKRRGKPSRWCVLAGPDAWIRHRFRACGVPSLMAADRGGFQFAQRQSFGAWDDRALPDSLSRGEDAGNVLRDGPLHLLRESASRLVLRDEQSLQIQPARDHREVIGTAGLKAGLSAAGQRFIECAGLCGRATATL